MLKVVEKSKIWFSIAAIIIIVGLGSLITKGLNFGIDFRGGTLVVIDMGKSFEKSEVDDLISKYASDAQTNKTNETELEIRSGNISNENISAMFNEIKEKYQLKENALVSQDTVGPSIGNEMKEKALLALAIASIAMLIYVGIRFEFNFGAAGMLKLALDVFFMITIYSLLQIPVNSSFIAAILTIIGYSINDAIVIFDRIRENQKLMRRTSVNDLVDISVTQTMTRSVNTGMTTLFTIISVYIFVPSVREFALPIIIGIVFGCFTSILIASTLWAVFKKMSMRRKA